MGDKQVIQNAVHKTLDFLYTKQQDYGEFCTYIADNPELDRCTFDTTPFITTFVLYALLYVPPDKQVISMREKAIDYLLDEMEDGLWRYWSKKRHHKSISPDLDDTCCASYIIKCLRPMRLPDNRQRILRCRNRYGVFRTWVHNQPLFNDVDAAVNANVLLFLGDGEEMAGALSYVIKSLEEGNVAKCMVYYLDMMTLYYLVSRAYYHGVSSLEQVRSFIIEKTVAAVLDGWYENELYTALAGCTLYNLGYENHGLIDTLVTGILSTQLPSGGWPMRSFFAGPTRDHSLWFGSQELTTAFCLEFLARSL